MNQIIINGKSFNVNGKSVSVIGDSVEVDGVNILSGLSGVVEVRFVGDLATLKSHNATVEGDVKGDIDCHNITCKNVGGSIDAHNVTCKGDVSGSIKAKNFS